LSRNSENNDEVVKLSLKSNQLENELEKSNMERKMLLSQQKAD